MVKRAIHSSYHKCVTYHIVLCIQILQAPLGRLRFAGEAYSADSYGEVLGALETGVTEANHIAAAIMKLAPKHPTTSMPWLASSLQLRFMSKL